MTQNRISPRSMLPLVALALLISAGPLTAAEADSDTPKESDPLVTTSGHQQAETCNIFACATADLYGWESLGTYYYRNYGAGWDSLTGRGYVTGTITAGGGYAQERCWYNDDTGNSCYVAPTASWYVHACAIAKTTTTPYDWLPVSASEYGNACYTHL